MLDLDGTVVDDEPPVLRVTVEAEADRVPQGSCLTGQATPITGLSDSSMRTTLSGSNLTSASTNSMSVQPLCRKTATSVFLARVIRLSLRRV